MTEPDLPRLQGVQMIDSRRTSFDNWIAVDSRTLRLSDNEQMIAHVVHFPPIALIIAVHGDQLVLVRQFRYPADTWIIELPAGRVETSESPPEAAARELYEETGFTAGVIREIGRLRISPHLSDEITHMFHASALTQGQMHPDRGEFLEPMLVPLTEVRRMVQEQEIVDAKTIAALSFANLL